MTYRAPIDFKSMRHFYIMLELMLLFAMYYVKSQKLESYIPYVDVPSDKNFMISHKNVGEIIDLSKTLLCTLEEDKVTIRLPLRLVEADIWDRRQGYTTLSCYKPGIIGAWVSGPCEFSLAIYGNVSITVKDQSVYIVECLYQKKVYSQEIRVNGQSISTVINYPNISMHLYHGYFPGEIISCVTKDAAGSNSWRCDDMPASIRNPLEMTARNYSCGRYSVRSLLQKCECSTKGRTFYVKFFVQKCYSLSFQSNFGDSRLYDSYDAGERISCVIRPDRSYIVHFNPSSPFKVDLNNINGSGSFWLEIPQNMMPCLGCRITCLSDFNGKRHLYPHYSKEITIITNYTTELESFQIRELTYGVAFRCKESYYNKTAVTVAMQDDNVRPPYSIFVQHSRKQKFTSTEGGWLVLHKSQESPTIKNKWLVYCDLNTSGLSTPRIVSFATSGTVYIAPQYPIKEFRTYVLDGFIYKCEGFNYRFVVLSCEKECNLVEIKSCPHTMTSFAVIRASSKEARVSIVCKGYRWLFDSNPAVQVQDFLVLPSLWNEVPSEILTAQNLTCARSVTHEQVHSLVYYGVKVQFQQNGRTWIVKSNVTGQTNYVNIPSENTQNLYVEYCCIDSINSQCDYDCKSGVMRRINIIETVLVTTKPELEQDEVTSLDPNTLISGKICLIYSVSSLSPKCLHKIEMVLIITQPGKKPQHEKGYGSVRLPDFKMIKDKNDIVSWNVSLIITNKFVIEPFVRQIRFKSGSAGDIRILPDEKTVFLIKESVECSLASLNFRESVNFNLRIITNGLMTTNIEKGIGVQLTSLHVGRNIVRCSLHTNDSIFAKRVITVQTPPIKVEILNHKNVLVVGESMTCEAWGDPVPTKEWWLIQGSGTIHIKDNKLTILPNTANGHYSYECEAQNIHGSLRKVAIFQVFNNYGWLNSPQNTEYEFLICTLLCLLLFFILFFILLYTFNDEIYRKDENMF